MELTGELTVVLKVLKLEYSSDDCINFFGFFNFDILIDLFSNNGLSYEFETVLALFISS